MLALILADGRSPAWGAPDLEVGSSPTLASRSYRTEDGLPSGVIYALAQDRDGYLWIGGSAGLVRFDGTQFVAWGTYGEPPLPRSEVRSLLADRDGSLWVGFTDGGAVSRVTKSRVQTYTTQDGLPEGVISLRAQERSGAVWAVGPGGIAVFHAGRWEKRQGVDGLPAMANDVREDRSGRLWVATQAGVFRRDSGESRFEIVDQGPASAVREDPQGVIWLVDPQRGLRPVLSGPARPSSGRAPAAPTGANLASDRRGHLWIGSPFRAGLHYVSIEPRTLRPTIQPLSDDRGVFDKLVLTLLQDSEGNIWAGTSGGLVRFYEPRAQKYSRANGLPDDNVRAIEPAANDGFWLGTAGGLARVTSKGLVEPAGIAELKGRSITSLHTDAMDRLWIGFADSTLGMLAQGRFSALSIPANASPESVITVRPDNRGGLWVCNLQDQGVYYGRGSTFTRVEDIFQSGRRGCATLLDRSGRLWLGFDDGSILVQEQGKGHRFLPSEGAPRGRVCDIHEDREQSVWLATTDGLGRYRGGKFSRISARNGLPSNYLTAVIEDREGNLWICANSGIIRLTKDEFERAVNDPSHRVLYTLYDSSDGVSDTPVCYGEPHAAQDENGRLWFTSLSGAFVIDPAGSVEQAVALSPRVERIVADDIVLTEGDISLPAQTAKVELHYTAVSLSAASKMRFQYRLDGFDTSWVDAGNRRQAFYTNLPPGRYRFQVRASINEAAGPATGYEFNVEPAFHQTRTFYGLIAAAATMVLWGAWQLRVRTLHNRYTLIMSERTRIGREIHDTVLQNMAGVALELEGVARQSPPPGAGLRDALARISNEIKDHIAEARHTIWELRSPEEGTANLEKGLREITERTVGSTEIRFEFTVVGTPRTCGREAERELVRIAREALRNSVRHSGATLIRIELRYAAEALHLLVSDNGVGFNVENHLTAETDHWGLLGMKERASRIGARFEMQSREDAGTTIEAVVPYTRAIE